MDRIFLRGDDRNECGIVTKKNKAWSFDARVAESSFVDTLLLVLEVIGEAPLSEPLQPTAEQLR